MRNKITKNLISGLVLTLVASVAFASGESWVAGNVAGGATVNHGIGGFSAGYEGGAGTVSFTGITNVSVEGGTGGFVVGRGEVAGGASSVAHAEQFRHSANVTSIAVAGSTATVNHGGFANSEAGSVANGSATSYHGWY